MINDSKTKMNKNKIKEKKKIYGCFLGPGPCKFSFISHPSNPADQQIDESDLHLIAFPG